jgi:hypothetical protein
MLSNSHPSFGTPQQLPQSGYESVSLVYDRCTACDDLPDWTKGLEYLSLGWGAEEIIRTQSLHIRFGNTPPSMHQ